MSAVAERLRDRFAEQLRSYLSALHDAGEALPDLQAGSITLGAGRIEEDGPVYVIAVDVTLSDGYRFTIRTPVTLAEARTRARPRPWQEPRDEVSGLLNRLLEGDRT